MKDLHSSSHRQQTEELGHQKEHYKLCEF